MTNIELKTKSVFGYDNVKMTLEVIGETQKAVKVNIETSFLEFGEKNSVMVGEDIWIPKYIMDKKTDKPKLEWIFMNKERQLNHIESGEESRQRAERSIAEIEAQYGYGDDYVNQIMGVRFA
jgi:hypothetical protein